MTINWKEFATQDFWFGIDRAGLHKTDHVILYAGAAILVLGVALALYKMAVKNQFLKKVAGRVSTIFMTIGFFEMLWFVLRFEYVNVLSTRLVAALILLVGLIWLYSPVKYLITRYSIDMAEAERKVQREKYLNRR